MKIEIEPTTRGSRGQRYRVLYQGEVLCESRNPELDACRALLARGVMSTLEVWHRGASYPASRVDIAEGAKWTVRENDYGLAMAVWLPWSGPLNGPALLSGQAARGDSAPQTHQTPDK